MDKQDLARGFRHFRNIELDGHAHNKGGVTLEYLAPAPLDNLPANAEVHVSIAICSRDDNFSFKDGRKLARERMGDTKFVCSGEQLTALLDTSGRDIRILRNAVANKQFLVELSDGERHDVIARLSSARLR